MPTPPAATSNPTIDIIISALSASEPRLEISMPKVRTNDTIAVNTDRVTRTSLGMSANAELTGDWRQECAQRVDAARRPC